MIRVFTGEVEYILNQEIMDIMQIENINENTEVVYSDNIDAQHPKNQIKQVNELIKDKKVKIVVTYSPYVLQKFSMHKQAGEDIEFYFMDEKGYLKNINDEMNIAFKSLADPLQNMTWN